MKVRRLSAATIVRRMIAVPEHQPVLAPLLLEAMKNSTQGKIFSVLCKLSACTVREISEHVDRTEKHIATTLIDLENMGLTKRLGRHKQVYTWGLTMPWAFLEPDITHDRRRTNAFKNCITNFRRGPENFASWHKNVEHLFALGQLSDPPIPVYEVFPQLLREDYGFFESAFPGMNLGMWAKEWMGDGS